jgi:DNA-binding response OmpR family regulator
VLVALTGYGRDCDRRRAMDAGADLFFVKPADLDELKAALADACQRGRKGPRRA